jgi:hypothetical protein
VSVWGGEENDPPAYGKVFIALKPYTGYFISQSTKDQIISSILKNKKVLAITPEIVDPEYFHVNLNLAIIYNPNLTTKSSSTIKQNVSDVISQYFSTELQKFDKDFNKSYLNKLVLEADQSIQSVIIKIKLQQRHTIFLNTENSFLSQDSIKLQNLIVPGSITSSRFYINTNNTEVLVQIVDVPDTSPPEDTGTGTIRIISSQDNTSLVPRAGTVNYGTGIVTLNNFIPTALPNNVTDFSITAGIQESSHNIQASRNQVLVLDDSVLNSFAGSEAGLTINVTAQV